MALRVFLFTLLLSSTFLFIITFTSPGLQAFVNDYDPVSGEPKCINCHAGDKKPSIDYRRDDSCLGCHNSGLSDKFISIDSKYEKTTIAYTSDSNQQDDTVRQKKESSSSEDMTYIPAGEFTMGTNEWWPKCQPEHKRVLNAFLIDKFEVTNKRYKRFVETTKRKAPDDWPNGEFPEDRTIHPVVFVNWYDAGDFCKWEGKRLPTEAEWEKAARGTDKRIFPWGNEFDAKKGNMPQFGKKDTMPVGSFENGKSPYGVYDMAGNVWEWTSDWFKPYPGNTHPDENYGEKYKVVRGGSWYDCTYYKCGISAPAYNRIFFNPLTQNNNFGFRCARDAE
ncbi:MAG: SUMF1/EgtB/PvdO family nonheme iron enzyme [Nitrospirae bacterium]|nr:SUMF1/EgtB/PvdO family nonheme iron enzyme [Nitrospirota bacterium]